MEMRTLLIAATTAKSPGELQDLDRAVHGLYEVAVDLTSDQMPEQQLADAAVEVFLVKTGLMAKQDFSIIVIDPEAKKIISGSVPGNQYEIHDFPEEYEVDNYYKCERIRADVPDWVMELVSPSKAVADELPGWIEGLENASPVPVKLTSHRRHDESERSL
jgi:hypothetical protein